MKIVESDGHRESPFSRALWTKVAIDFIAALVLVHTLAMLSAVP